MRVRLTATQHLLTSSKTPARAALFLSQSDAIVTRELQANYRRLLTS